MFKRGKTKKLGLISQIGIESNNFYVGKMTLKSLCPFLLKRIFNILEFRI